MSRMGGEQKGAWPGLPEHLNPPQLLPASCNGPSSCALCADISEKLIKQVEEMEQVLTQESLDGGLLGLAVLLHLHQAGDQGSDLVALRERGKKISTGQDLGFSSSISSIISVHGFFTRQRHRVSKPCPGWFLLSGGSGLPYLRDVATTGVEMEPEFVDNRNFRLAGSFSCTDTRPTTIRSRQAATRLFFSEDSTSPPLTCLRTSCRRAP
ncbi:hypothetical protein AMELA_G00245740 [Ameiurus melas]|uniref:Uncharacterized protein n=1 Tax=Ameiurus melas TaxID=219545 RepID=A0A7J5ZTB2_AMEME|nr:hypothetical protein AMELA_G00245740 [Ameiurus melas]